MLTGAAGSFIKVRNLSRWEHAMFRWTLLDYLAYGFMCGLILFVFFGTRPDSKLVFKKPEQERKKRTVHIICIIGLLGGLLFAVISLILRALGYK